MIATNCFGKLSNPDKVCLNYSNFGTQESSVRNMIEKKGNQFQINRVAVLFSSLPTNLSAFLGFQQDSGFSRDLCATLTDKMTSLKQWHS